MSRVVAGTPRPRTAPRPAWTRWAGSLGVVLGVYAVLIGASAWWLGRTPPPAASVAAEALQVELAPRAEAPPAPPTDVAQGPLQQAQHRAQPTPQPTPALRLPSQDQPDAQAAPLPDTSSDPQRPADLHNLDQTQAPPEVQATAGERYAAVQTTAGQRSTAQATWQALLLGHLEQHRRYPATAQRLRQQGVAYVRFAVDRHGTASNIRLGQGSGHPLLDAETLATVSRSSPVPVPPPEIEGDPVEVMVPVAFFIRPR
jgi:protein TonB